MNNFNNTILNYVKKQISFFTISNTNQEITCDEILFARKKMEFLFSSIKDKYSAHIFQIHHLNNSDYYAIFLYWLSFALFKNKKEQIATQIYLLNKMLHGIDLFYTREMPDIFTLSHPIGTIFGNAQYSNFLCVAQNCTIGGGG